MPGASSNPGKGQEALGFIPTEGLQAGMVLAEDLFSDRGQIVLAKEVVLANAHLAALRRWGDPEANIEGGSQAEMDSLEQSAPQQVERLFAAIVRTFPADDAVL